MKLKLMELWVSSWWHAHKYNNITFSCNSLIIVEETTLEDHPSLQSGSRFERTRNENGSFQSLNNGYQQSTNDSSQETHKDHVPRAVRKKD